MIKPVNGHLLIEPVKHESFVVTGRETYEEVGLVVEMPYDLSGVYCEPGDKVFFDSWLAAKYPKENDPEGYYWLVPWKEVRAVLPHEPIPEQQV